MNDLWLFQKKPKNYNGKLGEVAIKKWINYLWYFNEDCVGSCLFDDCIDYETIQRMPNKILEGQDQKSNDREEHKGTKNKINLKLGKVSNFLNKNFPFELFTNKSWKVFERLKCLIVFLRAHPNTWQNLNDCKQA